MVHQAPMQNPLTCLKNLELRIMEHFLSLNPVEIEHNCGRFRWLPPPPNVIKLNVDATFSGSVAKIAVVARDHNGSVLQAWLKQIASFDASCAEAVAIVWALEIASSLNFSCIYVESDAKLCVDAVLGKSVDCFWSFQTLCTNAQFLTLNFSFCKFMWVRREANSVAHKLAGFCPPHGLTFSCKMGTLPPFVKEAWLSDAPPPLVFLFFNKIGRI